jgi:hypothetical protein
MTKIRPHLHDCTGKRARTRRCRALVFSALSVSLGFGALLSAPGAAGNDGVLASATGSGHISTLGGNRTFAFSARDHGGAGDHGRLEINFHPGETSPIPHVIVNAPIDCLRVIGNVAIMSGVTNHTNFSPFENVRGIIAVQDNGEGPSAPPDLISGAIIVPATSPLDCNSVTPLANLPVEHGNVQVRSG